jgi:hypothetical protein
MRETCEDDYGNRLVAIVALRAELAKPEPEPVAWVVENEKYKFGSVLTFRPNENWHESWKAIPLYRKENL